jgi:soluble cytochrome b562
MESILRLKQQPRHGMADPPKRVSKSTANQAEISAAMTEMKNGLSDLGEMVTDYSEVVDQLNKEHLGLQTGIGKLAKVFDDYETSIVATIKSATFLEQRNKALNKSFGITSITAAALGESYDSMAKDLNTGGENIRKYAQNVNAMLPGMAKIIAGNEKFRTRLLGTNQFLTEHVGLTAEVSNGYEMFAAGAGKNSVELLAATSQWAAAFDEATGLTGTFAGIISEIGEMSADIQTTYNKMPGSLEKSVIKAKLLGTSFAKIEAMATKMLNIEESVGAELEYQLLSGKRLVNQDGESITEKLRIAKLSGNAEDQVKAMNDLLSTQGDVLDGNNYYAKQQLENLTGFTVAELTRQRQTQKLMEQGGMDKAKIEEFMNMDPTSFTKALADVKDTGTAALLQKLKENEGQKTTDELYSDMLKRERTEGIRVMMGGKNQTDVIAGARTEVEGSEAASETYMRNFRSAGSAAAIGQLQLMGSTISATLTPLESFGKTLPVVGAAMSTFITKTKEQVEKAFGTTQSGATGAEAGTGDTGVDAGVPVKPVNDGIIQFNPADKFTTVQLLASTERGQLNKAAETLTGGGNNGTAVVDPAPIAAAVAMAIQQAMAGINIVMSGEKLNKAMEFDNRTING